jgi:uncharacterized membrane protein
MNIEKLHVVIVHFPIGLVFSGFLAEIIYLASKKVLFKHAARVCIVLGGISAIAAVITGLISARGVEYSGVYVDIFRTHEILGLTAMSVGILAGAAAVIHTLKPEVKGYAAAYWVALLLFVFFVGAAGRFGGMLVHGYGWPVVIAEEDVDPLPDYANRYCPVMPEVRVDPNIYVEYRDKRIYVCCMSCHSVVSGNPEHYYEMLYGEDE